VAFKPRCAIASNFSSRQRRLIQPSLRDGNKTAVHPALKGRAKVTSTLRAEKFSLPEPEPNLLTSLTFVARVIDSSLLK
jgi:hypothetical protein